MIREIRLTNFKCFQDQTVRLGKLTILSGLNGSGKSTVLQSLLLLRQSYQQGFLPSKGLLLNGALIELGTAKDVLSDTAEDRSVGIELGVSAGNKETLAHHRWSFRYDPHADVMGSCGKRPGKIAYRSSLFGSNFQYLSAERIGPRSAYSMSDYVVNQQHQIGSRGEYAAHYLAAYGSQPIAIKELAYPRPKGDPSIESLELLHQVEAWLRAVSPGVRVSITPFQGIDTVQLQYSFIAGAEESNKYRPINVGFGLTYTLPVIVALLSAKPGSLVFIENPEAHLHGRGQRTLGSLAAAAAKRGVQVVIETHSDHILNGVRVDIYKGSVEPSDVQVQFFRRHLVDGHSSYSVDSPIVDGNGRLRSVPDGFFDEWDRALDELIAPKGSV